MEYPYKNIGNYLKHTREKLSESVAEVSGAVEIDVDTLNNIECGRELPSEEILLLMVSHFGLSEQEAEKVFKLAGYANQLKERDEQQTDDLAKVFALLPIDSRVLYSDNSEILVNDSGLTISFMQQNMEGKSVPAARVGLSHAHAEKLMNLLNRALNPKAPEPKLLSAPQKSLARKEKQ